MAEKKVAIDTDFFLKLTEDGKNGELFIKILRSLHIKPIMHKYVFEDELYGNLLANKMFLNGELEVISDDVFLETDDHTDYEEAFRHAYMFFNGERLDENVFTYNHKGESLGEIKTILLALYLGIDIFMSDDGGAKSYVKSHINSSRHPLEVYNIYDTCCLLAKQGNKDIKWRDLKGMAKRVFVNRIHLYKELRNIWHVKD